MYLGIKVLVNIDRYFDVKRATKDLLEYVRQDSVIIFDVGANTGQSVVLFKNAFCNPRIFSFEPDGESFRLLKSKYQNDPDVILHNVAIADRKGKGELQKSIYSPINSFYKFNRTSDWLQRVLKQRVGLEEDLAEAMTQRVDMWTIDDICAREGIEEIDLLKLDVQGFEDKCLIGAKRMIKENRIRFILVEVILGDLYEHALQIYDIEKLIVPFGYRLFSIINSIHEPDSGRCLQLDLSYELIVK